MSIPFSQQFQSSWYFWFLEHSLLDFSANPHCENLIAKSPDNIDYPVAKRYPEFDLITSW